MLTPFIDGDTSRLTGFTHLLALCKPLSPYGHSAKQQLQPYLPGDEVPLRDDLSLQWSLLLARRQSGKTFLVLEHLISQLVDWRDPLRRLIAGATLSDVELFQLKQLLYFHQAIQDALLQLPMRLGLIALTKSFDDLLDLLDPEHSGSPSFYISDAYSRRLANLRREARRLQRQRQDFELEEERRLAELTGLKLLPSGEIMISKFDREKKQRLDSLSQLKISRETYTDIYYERHLTQRETAWAEELQKLKDSESKEEERIRGELSQSIRIRQHDLSALLRDLGRLDLLLAKVKLGQQLDCSCPEIIASPSLALAFLEARHPKVSAELSVQDRQFSPIGLSLSAGVSVITGANMGGKTVSLRLVGLLAAMAQHGFLVPAKRLKMTLFAGIRLVAAEYSADTPGLSRFGAEVEGLLDVIPHAGSRCLLLYDELASSTNPAEGAALAQAVIEYLVNKQSISLFTTHYESLSRLEGVSHWQVVGLSRANQTALAEIVTDNRRSWRELADLMDYNLQPVPPGQPVPREALRVGKLMGLPESIILRAAELILARATDREN